MKILLIAGATETELTRMKQRDIKFYFSEGNSILYFHFDIQNVNKIFRGPTGDWY